ncbi:MAG: DNA recombination protein RmuC [Dermatophilaceae bacterium]
MSRYLVVVVAVSVASEMLGPMDLPTSLTLAVGAGALFAWLAVRGWYAARLAALGAERDGLRERVEDLQAVTQGDAETARLVVPLRESLARVERQVHTLERDRGEQFARVTAELSRVEASTTGLREQTADLVGSLRSSSVRGAWGEVQLRRVLEHAGLLARCDFDTQVSGRNDRGELVRPDVVVHLPGDRHLVVDAKVPLSAFLAAQAEGLTGAERAGQLGAHARALRAHVQGLAAKGYWTATADSPPLVVCFVPGEAILGAALAADPALHEDAMAAGVVLASPATLLAVLRTVAYAWQQEALADGARELLDVGRELYARIGALGRHAERLGNALLRSVTAYNGLVGSLEARVLVTARRMNELGLGPDPVATPRPLDEVPRALTAVELIEALDADVARSPLLEESPPPRRRCEAG